MKDKHIKYIKILWLPVLVVLFWIVRSCSGIDFGQEYAIGFFAIELALFGIYVYILARSGLLFRPRAKSANVKGKRKAKGK